MGKLSKFDLWDLNSTNWNAKGVNIVLKLDIDKEKPTKLSYKQCIPFPCLKLVQFIKCIYFVFFLFFSLLYINMYLQ